MKIKIIDSEVVSLLVKPVNDDVFEDENSLHFGFTPKFSEEESRDYCIDFQVNVVHKAGYRYEIEYRSHFSCDDVIDEQFKSSKFISVNSPAIAFPFLRAYVANLLLLSGHDPIMLPTINFVALADREGKSRSG
ncbi:protein-export chaperone SecB [Shewanella aegiceratis]|uniref:protein-export chaperone SecB n=1 Tax=Shewanella aegiceratis TaxID=2864203 RepID=UPI001C65E8F2|nr:protein-export chaperone SecB [Shewanella aegiceratis]QYJ83815.1 protein-export chaperone SecB [Shewanella aegiceratis]